MIPKETDFVKVPAKVLRTQIMKYALFCSFKDSVKGRCCISMDIPTGIFFLTVVDPIMRGILSARKLIRMIFIGHQMRFFIDKAIKKKDALATACIGT
jgi:hypothetical protein